MKRSYRHAVRVLLLLFIVMPILGSCGGAGSPVPGDGAYLGNALVNNGPVYHKDKTDFSTPGASGTLSFGMMGSPVVTLDTATVTSNAFNLTFGVPTGKMVLWSTVIGGLPGGTVSDPAACGFVVNSITFDITSPAVASVPVIMTNYAGSVIVTYVYSDRDVTSAASGAYTAPDGVSATINMNLILKTGWNRCVLTRTGSPGTYVDTWSVGDEPAGVCWAYGWT
jgi:hypothetical protein